MIHLFNKVYIKSDKFLKISKERVVISKEFGSLGITQSTLVHDLSNSTPIDAEFTHKTYKDLVNEKFQSDEKEFFNYLLNWDKEKRLTIYCDADALMVLLTKYWKTIYKDWNFDFYLKMVNFTLTFNLEVMGTGRTYVGSLREQSDADDLYKQTNYWLLDENRSILLDLWKNTTPWVISSEIDKETLTKNCSMEYQLASVLYNANWEYADIFKNKFVRSVKKELINEYCTAMRSVVLKSLVNFKWLEPETKFDIRKHDLEDLIELHPQYKFLNDTKFKPEEVDYVYKTYDMVFIKQLNDKLWNHPFGFEIDWSPMIKNDLSFEDIISFEMERPLNRLLFRYGEYYETVNSYLLDYILDSVRENNIENLKILELK